jgi:hypothetical protein
MSPGQTFRAICEHCGTIFFSPVKSATACSKCAKKWGVKPARGLGDGPKPSAPARSTEAPGLGHPVALPASPPPAPAPPPAPPAAPAPAAPKPPLATELTEESRAAIIQGFAELRAAGAELKAINQRLSRQLGIQRRRVAEVTSGLLQAVRCPPLTPEQRAAVETAYRGYVERSERPEGGRKAAIARATGLSRAEVARVVQAFNKAMAAEPLTSRDIRFRIETAYWRLLHETTAPLTELWPVIAAEVGVDPWALALYLDVLHEDPQRLAGAEPVAPDQAAAITAAYEGYLRASAPPAGPLHATIAAAVGVTTRQVYRVLLEYRWMERRRLRGVAGSP